MRIESASLERNGPKITRSDREEPVAAALLDAHARDMAVRYPEGVWGGVGAQFDAFWLAWLENRALGCVGLRQLAPDRVEVKHLYVDPTARRRGVAAALMDAFELEAARRHAGIVLETGTRQPEAISLYRARGYRRRGPYPGCDVEDACSVYFELTSARTPSAVKGHIFPREPASAIASPMSDLLLVAATERELIAVDGAQQLCCGIGPVEAALATAHTLAQARYASVLHVGIAGALELEPGTLVIGSEAIYCDVIDAKATLPRVDRVAAAPALIDAARDVSPRAPVVPIGTCARVGGGFACAVEAMEGFGVLRAAELTGVPALEVRVISNVVTDADRSRWMIPEALAVLEDAVARLVPALLAACSA